jgi:hypothetical protein
LCFENTHKDVFFPTDLYTSEKDSYFFKGFIKKEELKSQQEDSLTLEEADFLYKPRLTV